VINMNIKIKKSLGFTLVEVMVAVLIGLILMTGVTNIYLSNKETFRTNEELTRFQENGRYITNVMNNELRRAGHAGCMNVFQQPIDFTNSFSATSAAFYKNPVNGFELSTTSSPNPSLPTGTSAPATSQLKSDKLPVDNSDIISIQYGSSEMIALSTDMANRTANMQLAARTDGSGLTVDDGDFALISDCRDANVFVAGSAGDKDDLLVGGPSSGQLTKPFKKSEADLWPTVMLFNSYTYYVGASHTEEVNALYRRDNLNDTTEKLFEGVESIDLLYGAKVTGNKIQYMDADELNTANLMNKIEVIKVDFTLRSVKKTAISGGRKGFTTRVFSTTINLRNQG
jgi:type IV pilus assembly protein PilW